MIKVKLDDGSELEYDSVEEWKKDARKRYRRIAKAARATWDRKNAEDVAAGRVKPADTKSKVPAPESETLAKRFKKLSTSGKKKAKKKGKKPR